jgi:hypothetical protein
MVDVAAFNELLVSTLIDWLCWPEARLIYDASWRNGIFATETGEKRLVGTKHVNDRADIATGSDGMVACGESDVEDGAKSTHLEGF